jgi:hypothetical protein
LGNKADISGNTLSDGVTESDVYFDSRESS